MYQLRGINRDYVWVDNLDINELTSIYFDLVINNLSMCLSFVSCYEDMFKHYPITKELIAKSLRCSVTVFDTSVNKEVTNIFGCNIKDDGSYYSLKADHLGYHGHYEKSYMEDHLKFIKENHGNELRLYSSDLSTQSRQVIGFRTVTAPRDGIFEANYIPNNPNRLILNENSFNTLLEKLKDKHRFFNYDF